MIQPVAALGCYKCLCEVCNRMHCPKRNRRYLASFCASMMLRDRCPVVKCDFFEHKQKHKVYRIIRREKKRDKLAERLEAIEGKLDALCNRPSIF